MEWQHFACKSGWVDKVVNGEGIKENGNAVFILKYHILYLFQNANTEGKFKNNNKKALHSPHLHFLRYEADL